MSTFQDNFINILKTNGLSITRQRQLLFDLLQDQDPLSMNELTELVGTTIDRASVYRIIATFEETGIVRRISIGWKFKIELSEAFVAHHHHLTCLSCQLVVPINQEKLESFISELADINNFQPIQHQVEIQGYCQRCQANRNIA
ncbi:transcriptional repressor [Candidatus Saccharibacteria bacterium]|nr:transcriptional repressor [Candidatus Saccharibacteria bacterium]